MTREELASAITTCLRAGVYYRYCDTDGYHDEITFRDGRYVHVDGFRATSNAPKVLADEHAALALVYAIHPKPGRATELQVLEAILNALRAGTR